MAGSTRTVVAALILAGLLVAAMAVPVVGQSTGQLGGPVFPQTGTTIDADAVLLAVDLQGDGTARWRVEYRVRLDDENTTAAFEALQADVEANESAYAAPFEARMVATVDDASAATGREMTLRNVSVTTATAQLPQRYGVLLYTFEWTNFAVVDGDRLAAGDALAGLFLDADSTLLLAWPEGHSVVEVSPTPTEQRDRSVIWRGPVDFGPGEPDLVLSSGDGSGGLDTSVVGVVVVLAVLVGLGGAWWWRRRATAAVGPSGSPATVHAGATSPHEELLSNEERVIALLEQHGGRMKQQTIVEELGWTDAKTSQVVGRLRDAGRIEGFRLGRENVLRLPAVEEGIPDDRPAVDEPRGG